MSDSMVERVASVIAMEIAELNASQRKTMKFPDDFNGDTIDRATCCARAAIQAMREPTEAMLNAARDWSERKYGKPVGNDAAIGCLQAMIDAALSGGKP